MNFELPLMSNNFFALPFLLNHRLHQGQPNAKATAYPFFAVHCDLAVVLLGDRLRNR